MSANTHRIGSILGLLRTALTFGLAVFAISSSMNWFNERDSLDIKTAQDKAEALVNGYCHRSGSPVCMPELINVDAVPAHDKIQNIGWKFLYRISPTQQMRVDIDGHGGILLATASPRPKK